jgi:SAM-dependent methyltransferase
MPRAADRFRHHPPRFVLRHPLRTARNVVGNHPSALASRYLSGLRGIEIGGASYNRFFLNTINVDHRADPSTGLEQLQYAGYVLPVDVIAPADALPLGDGDVDFVLASHVIEHLTDPIKALREWARVARRYLFVIVPSRDSEVDRGRPLTPLAEQLERNRIGWTNPSQDMTHWSVWDPASFAELCERIGLRVAEIQDPDDKRGDGFAVVIELGGGGSE